MNHIEAAGEFTEELWNCIRNIFQQIIKCRFVVELSEGSLPIECFEHYLAQDVLYLKQDNEAFLIVSKKALDFNHSIFFKKIAADGIGLEEVLHDEYLSYFNIKEAEKQSPMFRNYGNFILKQAKDSSYPIAIAALLPCFWVYSNVGKIIIDNCVDNNKYQKFIDTYAGEQYEEYVRQFVKIVEEVGGKSSFEEKIHMKNVFKMATTFEYRVFQESCKIDC